MPLPLKQSSTALAENALNLPDAFPVIPEEVVTRFPQMGTWMKSVDRWYRSHQNGLEDFAHAIQNVEEIAGVLTVDGRTESLYIRTNRASGKYAQADTPFFVDREGFFSLGRALTWNPLSKELTVEGNIIATTGSIGGFVIGPDYIRDTADSFGLSSAVSAGDDVRFWAGDTFANRATAPFRVTESGTLTAASATLTGSITIATTDYLLVTTDAAYPTWQAGGITPPGMFFQHDTASSKGIGILGIGTNASAVLTLNKARGVFGTMTTASTDDTIGQIRYYAYTGSAWLAMGVSRVGITNSVATPYHYMNVGGSGAPNYYLILNYDGKLYFSDDNLNPFNSTPSNSLGAPYVSDTLANIYRPAIGELRTDGGWTVGGYITTLGGRKKHVKVVTGAYTVDTGGVDEVVIGSHATVAFTITVPAASANTNRVLYFGNRGAAGVTLDATGRGQIAGANTQLISQFEFAIIVSDGSTWTLLSFK